MKNFIQYAFALGISALFMTSCNLDEYPNSSISYQEGNDMITSIADMQKLQNGMYQSYRLTHYGQISEAEEFMCDGFNATSDYGNNYGSIHRTDATFTPADYDTRDMWAIMYYAIKNYNLFIQHIANFQPANDSEANAAKVANAEAHFFRAAAYLQLVRHFGKAYGSTSSTDLAVPLITVYDQEAKPARATVAEVYAQVKSDLDVAAAGLASVSGKVGAVTPTIDAVNALYARYYIDTKDYGNAATYAERVINSSAGYALSKTAEEMVAEYTNDNGKEPIMQLAATLAESGATTPFANITNEIRNNSYTLATSSEEQGVYLRPYFIPSKKLVDSYEDGDLRLQQWLSKSVKVNLNGGFYTDKFYAFVKYLGNPALRSGSVPNARHKVKPFLIGEMYLIAAEANLKGNNADKAKTLLNTLQEARNATATEATEATVETEWFKETVGEGLRMSCLKRWNKGFSGRPIQEGTDDLVQAGPNYASKVMNADDNHWQWPVPTYEIEINANLVQNPGY